tara:strand:+ start:2633 stop:3079 length:447 start_codon:yes stop_codon:yes gene_type:complete
MATLTTTVTESVVLNGSNQGSSNTLSITGINDVYKRIVSCPASATTTVLTFNDAVTGAAGAVDAQLSKYIRVTNLDSTNPVELAVVGAATLYQVTLAAGHSHVLGSADDLMLAQADTSPSFGTMADIVTLQVNPAGNAVSVELFIASA